MIKNGKIICISLLHFTFDKTFHYSISISLSLNIWMYGNYLSRFWTIYVGSPFQPFSLENLLFLFVADAKLNIGYGLKIETIYLNLEISFWQWNCFTKRSSTTHQWIGWDIKVQIQTASTLKLRKTLLYKKLII